MYASGGSSGTLTSCGAKTNLPSKRHPSSSAAEVARGGRRVGCANGGWKAAVAARAASIQRIVRYFFLWMIAAATASGVVFAVVLLVDASGLELSFRQKSRFARMRSMPCVHTAITQPFAQQTAL